MGAAVTRKVRRPSLAPGTVVRITEKRSTRHGHEGVVLRNKINDGDYFDFWVWMEGEGALRYRMDEVEVLEQWPDQLGL